MTDQSSPSIVDITGGNDPSSSVASILDERSRMAGLRRLMLGIVAIVLVLIGWSAIAQIDELAKAQAEILPKSRLQVVQSREGGVLVEMLVREDDRVEEGQVIARFDPTAVLVDATSLNVRRAGLSIDIERWGAIAEGRQPDFSAFSGSYPELTFEAEELFRTQQQEASAIIGGLSERVSRLRSLVDELVAERGTVSAELATVRDTYERLSGGADRGVVPALRVNEARERMLQVQARVEELDTRLRDTRSQILVAENELDQAMSNIVVSARTERSKLIEQRAEVEAAISGTQGRRGQLEVLSPVTGIVKDVPDNVIGAVVAPGGTVAEIVPTDGGLFLQAKLLPRDIGFVRVGQSVLAKVDAFDFARFGAVRGTVTRVSPTAFTDQRTGLRHYLVDIELNQDHVGADESNALVPGMTGEADIVTGEKTIFQYILKPVFVGLDSAFHER